MDKDLQVVFWALGMTLLGSLLIGKNILDYKKNHSNFHLKTFSKAMVKSLIVGNTMIFGLLFFWIGVSILIFKS